MTRFALAAVFALALASQADAQYLLRPDGTYPRGATAGGNLHNYDTGDYLLGGFAGLARTSGTFTMVGPGGPGFGGAYPAGPDGSGPRCNRFHHLGHSHLFKHRR